MKAKNFRKRSREGQSELEGDSDGEQERMLALEEVKFLQKQRERKSGVATIVTNKTGQGGGNGGASLDSKATDKNETGDGEKDELVLQDTFAQETAVMVEDPHMIRYVEQELAKRRGKNINETNQVENDIKHAEDELYKIPEHLKNILNFTRIEREKIVFQNPELASQL